MSVARKRGVGRLNGCGTPIGGVDASGPCGEVGLCVTCWAQDHDQHVPTLKAQRDEARAALRGLIDALGGEDDEPDATLIGEAVDRGLTALGDACSTCEGARVVPDVENPAVGNPCPSCVVALGEQETPVWEGDQA